MANRDRRPDEESPLLQLKAKTPLRWGQPSLVYLGLIAEPVSVAYIFPFINQLIGELGITRGDDRKIGYYDFVGRRPIILLGLLGLSASNLAFGLSRTLATLIISRWISGVFNGNICVMKSFISDVTDHTNMAQA